MLIAAASHSGNMLSVMVRTPIEKSIFACPCGYLVLAQRSSYARTLFASWASQCDWRKGLPTSRWSGG